MGTREISIVEAPGHVGECVAVKGWIRHIRSSGSIYFIDVRDGTGVIQGVVVQSEVAPEVAEACSQLKIESSLMVVGTLKEERRAPNGCELTVHDIQVVQIPPDEYPLSKKAHGTDFLMENRHLWIRSSRQLDILRVRSELIRQLRAYFYDNGYVLIDTPILTGSIGEDAGNLFSTRYFDLEDAYLAQTGQLYLEAAASAFGRVFNLGPTFRAEKSKTRRHLTEFWMLEAEVAYFDTNDNMGLQEDLVSTVVGNVVRTCEGELAALGRDTAPLLKVEPPFPRISYDEAVEMLKEKGHPISWGDDIGGDEETELSTSFEKPVFIYNYPTRVKPFYMKPNDDGRTVLNDDLLAPEGYGEIIGGSQRNEDYGSLLQRIEEDGLNPENYRWYLDIRKFGSVVHSGFGLGVERLLSWICLLPHVREAIPFPRLINRLYP